MKKPCFIGGTGRCGTTILRQTMARHHDITALPGELRVVVDSHGAVDLFRDLAVEWGPYRADYAVWQFEQMMMTYITTHGGPKYRGHRIDEWTGSAYWKIIQDFIDNLVKYKTDGSWTGAAPKRTTIYEVPPQDEKELAEHIRSLFHDIFNLVGGSASWWLDDTPYSILRIHSLRNIFPNSKYIHIYRHPMDVLASYERIRTRNRRWTSDSCQQNAYRIKNILDEAPWRGDDVLAIRFEDFVEQHEETLKNICEFMELDWDPQTINPKVDPTSGHVGYWEDQLDERQQEVGYRILEDWVRDLGYE